jgi:hypothetical protein
VPVAVGTTVYPPSPARTRAGAANAHGSYLGCWGIWQRSAMGVGLQNWNPWQYSAHTLPETFPGETTALASSPQRLVPHTQHVLRERLPSCPVAWDGVIWEIPPHLLYQPLAGGSRRSVHALPQLRPDILELGCPALADRPAVHREVSGLWLVPLMWVKPRKWKVSGFPCPRFSRRSAAERPNSIRRFFSGYSSRPNFRNRSRICPR